MVYLLQMHMKDAVESICNQWKLIYKVFSKDMNGDGLMVHIY
jgi:hypothetical protein